MWATHKTVPLQASIIRRPLYCQTVVGFAQSWTSAGVRNWKEGFDFEFPVFVCGGKWYECLLLDTSNDTCLTSSLTTHFIKIYDVMISFKVLKYSYSICLLVLCTLCILVLYLRILIFLFSGLYRKVQELWLWYGEYDTFFVLHCFEVRTHIMFVKL